MPRGKAQAGSVSGWFREYFTTHRDLLKTKSNADVFKAWSEAHSGKEPGKAEKQALANVKSDLKKRFGIGKRGRKKKMAMAGASDMALPTRPTTPSHTLEKLEYAIDRCLDMARNLEDPELAQTVKHLRLARNDVILKNG
jgi:hypothetical protein